MSDIFKRIREQGRQSSLVRTGDTDQQQQDVDLSQEAGLDETPIIQEADQSIARQITQDQINKNRNPHAQKSFGRTNIYVDHEIHDDSGTSYFLDQDYRDGNELPDTDISDPLRFVSRKYWQSVPQTTEPSMFFAKKSFEHTVDVPFSIEIAVGSSEITNTENFFEVRTPIRLKPRKERFAGNLIDSDNDTFNPALWESYLKGDGFTFTGRPDVIWDPIVNLDQNYYDHFFYIDTPFTRKQLKGQNDPPNSRIVEIEPEVNFVLEDYFDTISNGDIDDTLLPNVYSLRAQVNLGRNDRSIRDHNTLKGNVRGVLEKSETNGVITFSDSVNYLESWTNTIGTVDSSVRAQLSKKYTNIILSPDEITPQLYQEIDESSETFPVNMHVEFSTDKVGQFSTALRETTLSTKLLEHISSTQAAYEATADGIFGALSPEFSQKKFKHCKCYGDSAGALQDVELDVYDLEEWLKKLEDEDNSFNLGINLETGPQFESITEKRRREMLAALKVVARESSVFLDVFKNSNESENMEEFYKSLVMMIFRSRMRGIVKNQFRSFLDIMKGDAAYSDTVAYKISKFEVNSSGVVSSEPIQSIYFFNNNEMDFANYIDTQIKYNKPYVYKIWAYKVVVGNEYKYVSRKLAQDIVFSDIDGERVAGFDVINKPSVKIVEVPYFTSKVLRALERPPLPPQMEFFPYLGSDSELLISLTNPTGEMMAVPVEIETTDAKPVFYMTQAQEPDDEGRIQYRGDDQIRLFEVFRTTTAPRSYRDFEGELAAYVHTATPEVGSNTDETSYSDSILPNQNYYYMARSIDVNNNLSNPSSVFEVQIVNDGGIIYPIVKSYDFPEPEEKHKIKKASKYLRLRVALPQRFINLERSGLKTSDNLKEKAKDIKLGTADETVWDRKFKIRLTSNETGRKIDINIRFKYEPANKKFKLGTKLQGQDQIVVVEADTFSQALQLLLVEQSDALI